MLAGILGLSYFGLCCISFLVSNLHKGKVEKFLNQNPVISDGKVLDEFKVIAREGMYITLLQLSIFGISLVIAGLLLWLKGIKTGISFGVLWLAFGYANEVDKVAKKARELDCTSPDLERRYKAVVRAWKENMLPNF